MYDNLYDILRFTTYAYAVCERLRGTEIRGKVRDLGLGTMDYYRIPVMLKYYSRYCYTLECCN